MRDKIRIELSSANRLAWEPFYAVLDLPATAQQIRDAKQRARITGIEDMTYQEISFLGFDPLPDLEHLRLDTTTVEELNYLAQRLDTLLLSSKIGPVLANNFPPQLLKNLFSVSEAPALIIKVQYLALMRQPVQQSCCEDSVAKKLRPAIKAFI